ncbi:MAG: monofunctional biosynthetic peptidoglycan transglycosylase [Pseudomonadota bacterium]
MLIALMIRWIDPPYSMFMWQQSRALGQQKSIHQEWVDWEFISDELKIAVIAAEDQRFLEHSGFDWDAIAQTWQARQAGTSRGGASTISQQLAKNLFLWSGQSWIRKGIEAWLTVAIELIVPKQRILEIYLNIAQWGDAQFGAEAASEFFFAKSARELTRWEAALLAAVLPNPVIYRVNAPSRYVTERQRWIVRNVRRLGGPGYLSEL